MFKKVGCLIACICACLGWAGVVVAAETIKTVQISTELDRTHLVFNLTGPVKYTTSTLSNPDRLVIDVRDARLAALRAWKRSAV